MPARLFSFNLLLFFIYSCNSIIPQTATAKTAGNDPTIKKGESFTYAKSVEPKQFDFICFLGEVPNLSDKFLMIYRLCGMPGDIVEIKNGDLYVNNKPVDNKFSLKHNYLIPKEEFERIKNTITIDDNYSTDFQADTLIIPMDDQFVLKNKIQARRQILPPSLKDSFTFARFGHLWNQDNFGPIKVPMDAYFVLGDNRNNAWDSRYQGFVNKKDFLGTVVLSHLPALQ
ncbi:MAG: signal peptidase I [Bacteroidota bacterium]|nr:signal peptidase I [Bacteroidota bacterium]MDP4252498.1 signal peptidase I [Bacteroidota bacterium]